MKRRTRLVAVLLIALLLSASIPAFALQGAVAKKTTTLYTDSDMKGRIGTLSKYTAVLVEDVASGVACIHHEGSIYYVSAKALCRPWEDLVAELLSEGIETTWEYNRYTIQDCYIYNYPSKEAGRKKKIEKGTDVTACYEKDGWTQVLIDDYYGYIRSENLKMRHM